MGGESIMSRAGDILQFIEMKMSKQEFAKMKKEFDKDYPLVFSDDRIRVYDDKAGGAMLDLKTLQAWCLGEMGADEGDFPPNTLLLRAGLKKSDLPLRDDYWKTLR